jgi:hypothetical protein
MSRRRSVSRIASSDGAIPEETARADETVADGDGDGAEPADEHAVATTTIATAIAALPLLLRSRTDVSRDDRLDPAANVEVTDHLHPLWFRRLCEVIQNSVDGPLVEIPSFLKLRGKLETLSSRHASRGTYLIRIVPEIRRTAL